MFLVILFAYDLRWFLLPNKAMFPLLGVAGVIALFSLAVAENIFYGVLDLAGATVILSGLYFALWWLSKGEWIGFGDVKLGLALALLLGRWELAFIALFAANLVGMLIVLPGLLLGKISRKTHVPFGPLLIIGALISFFVGHVIIDWYMTATIPFWATS